MPEGNINAEVAEKLRETRRARGPESHSRASDASRPSRSSRPSSSVIVALATALSGYQAALFDGESAKEYATSSRLRVEASNTSLTANQQLAYNAGNLTAWLRGLRGQGRQPARRLLERRFLPNYKQAFDAWVETDPLNRPRRPCRARVHARVTKTPWSRRRRNSPRRLRTPSTSGVETRLIGEDYVRVTVVLAAALFLIAIGQRFKVRGVRWSVNGVAGVLLIYCVVLFVSYPHIYPS